MRGGAASEAVKDSLRAAYQTQAGTGAIDGAIRWSHAKLTRTKSSAPADWKVMIDTF